MKEFSPPGKLTDGPSTQGVFSPDTHGQLVDVADLAVLTLPGDRERHQGWRSRQVFPSEPTPTTALK
jgi:hypothetical protein